MAGRYQGAGDGFIAYGRLIGVVGDGALDGEHLVSMAIVMKKLLL